MSLNLHVSSKNMNCKTIAKLLLSTGTRGHVFENVSAREHGIIEPGCTVVLSHKICKPNVRMLWRQIKQKYNVDCAYVDSPTFKGCVLDYMQDTKCSGVCD